mmetsp:Transcript_25299/g.50473  ORF Transcript_25299/g.50473 Transcript_25299/m.50473 type:complete len:92 (-) Transcript_25299:35-310(-)
MSLPPPPISQQESRIPNDESQNRPPLPPILKFLHSLLPRSPKTGTTYPNIALVGMLSLLTSTTAVHVLGPMRDASVLVVGIDQVPRLTFLR